MHIDILYEDDAIVAINKPSGFMTHPDGRTHEETVSEWFATLYPDSREVGEPMRLPNGGVLLRPGIVHRLDRETSGVLLLAKTKEAHAHLKTLFQTHAIEKKYLAFCYGVVPKEPGTITLPIGRSQKDFRLRSAQRKARGTLREAVTAYHVLGTTGTHSLLEVFPKTGRTHQIRVHLKAIHHPIVCDTLYAPNHPCDLGFTRLGLHAISLTFTTLLGKRVTVEAPLPPDLESAKERFSVAS